MIFRRVARPTLLAIVVLQFGLLGSAPALAAAPSQQGPGAEGSVVPLVADLAVTQSVWPDPVHEVADVIYRLTITNRGPDAASAVTLADAIPTGTTFVSFTQTSGPPFSISAPGAGGTGTVVATAPTFVGTSATFDLIVHVVASPGEFLTNLVTVTAATGDPHPASNSWMTRKKVHPAADLSVTKTDPPDPVIAGDDITYTIVAANAGPSDAQNVTISDAIPANTTFVSLTQTSGPAFTLSSPPSGGTGTVTANRDTFADGASATFELVVNVDATTADGTRIYNTVTISTDTCDPDPSNNSDTERTDVEAPVGAPSADLAAAKSDSPDPVGAGQNITYTITVTSAGPNDAQDVTVSDSIPANTTFVSFTQTSGTAFTLDTPPAGGTGTVTATTSTFAAGATATFDLVVNVNTGTADGTVITNTVTVSSGTGDPAPANNSATTTTTVIGEQES